MDDWELYEELHWALYEELAEARWLAEAALDEWLAFEEELRQLGLLG